MSTTKKFTRFQFFSEDLSNTRFRLYATAWTMSPDGSKDVTALCVCVVLLVVMAVRDMNTLAFSAFLSACLALATTPPHATASRDERSLSQGVRTSSWRGESASAEVQNGRGGKPPPSADQKPTDERRGIRGGERTDVGARVVAIPAQRMNIAPPDETKNVVGEYQSVRFSTNVKGSLRLNNYLTEARRNFNDRYPDEYMSKMQCDGDDDTHTKF